MWYEKASGCGAQKRKRMNKPGGPVSKHKVWDVFEGWVVVGMTSGGDDEPETYERQ